MFLRAGLLALLVSASATQARACAPERDAEYVLSAELARVDAVATVWVESAQSVPGPEGDLGEYTGGIFHFVRVDEVLKGTLPQRFAVFSDRNSGRFDMEVDREYLVFLYRDDPVWFVDACGNSGEARLREHVLARLRARAHKP
jgi:hypothetical protein